MIQKKYKISVIISGGQTGADRGALDYAIKKGIKHSGWCPFGRKAEDGIIPSFYKLKETTTPMYPARTRMNIRDSDATIIFSSDINSKGSLLTTKFCIELKKPYYVVLLDKKERKLIKDSNLRTTCQKLIIWLNKIKPDIINIAGTRESHCIGIQNKVESILELIIDKSEKEKEWPPIKPATPNLCFN
ncbi:MAG: putative molybdenum carrier protein [Candidatus Riflebacteria bacterium]|jgi:predicted Rossmann fold nucleotide-binding protein DprA/Smf involved in DNA uptake|nr:putative molybdenum carrier protein [Candidatus Riflebacteria bacterium]